MSTVPSETNPHLEATQRRRLKTRPTASAKLWGHLLSTEDPSQTISHLSSDISSSTSFSNLTPMDKTGTSLRILLHDTQANLENFSDRVNKLAGNIDESKREISAVKELYQQGHEKVVEDIVDLVNRCQLEVQRAVGAPAQAVEIKGLRVDLMQVDNRLKELESRMNMLQMLNQTQLQALQTVQNQQGAIIAAISSILPLLQGVPLHIEKVKGDTMDGLRDTHSRHGTRSSRTPANDPQAAPVVTLRHSPYGPSSSNPSPEHQDALDRRKKRKLGDENYTSGTPTCVPSANVTGSDCLDTSQAIATAQRPVTDLRLVANITAAQPVAPGSTCHSPGMTSRHGHRQQNPFRTPHRQPLMDLPQSNATSRKSRSPMLSTAPILSARAAADDARSARRIDRSPDDALRSDITALRQLPRRQPPIQMTPKNADSLASTTSTLSQASVVQHGYGRTTIQGRPDLASTTLHSPSGGENCQKSPFDLRKDLESRPPSAIKSRSVRKNIHTNATLAVPLIPVRQDTQSQIAGTPGPYSLKTARASHTPLPTTAGKPMSIKDVRTLTATPAIRNEKRFIPLDDDDDDLLA